MARKLDYESKQSFILTIQVSDGGLDGSDQLTANTTVYISILDTNEYAPTFIPEIGLYEVEVEEKKLHTNVLQVGRCVFR